MIRFWFPPTYYQGVKKACRGTDSDVNDEGQVLDEPLAFMGAERPQGRHIDTIRQGLGCAD